MKLEDNQKIKVAMYLKNFALGFLKIIIAILSKSVIIFISAFYTLGIGLAKRNTLSASKEDDYKKYFSVGIILLISNIIYIIYTLYIYFTGNSIVYHRIVAIAIAVFGFITLILSILGVINARKEFNIENKVSKLIGLSSAFVFMSFTQATILSFTMRKVDASRYGTIGSVTFGILSMLVSIYMIIFIKRHKENIMKNAED